MLNIPTPFLSMCTSWEQKLFAAESSPLSRFSAENTLIAGHDCNIQKIQKSYRWEQLLCQNCNKHHTKVRLSTWYLCSTHQSKVNPGINFHHSELKATVGIIK